jgi:membrane AbrB-like protein
VTAAAKFTLLGTRAAAQWALLSALSLAFAAALTLAQLPAALLLGAIAGGALVASFDGKTRVDRRAFIFAQMVLGALIARGMKLEILQEIARDWPLFVAAALSVILAACLLGWLLTRWRVFPDSTAIWGSLPGAAAAMALLAEAYGADMRLVAFMQYLRVLLVALLASLVARFFAPGATAQGYGLDAYWAPVNGWAFAETCALLLACAGICRFWRIPAGPLLLPLALGAGLQDAGLMIIELPRPLLAASYAILGWSIGLRFDRAILAHALRSLPAVTASVTALLAVCAGFAWVLARYAGIDPMTAYLATSPGGVDAIAIIATSIKVDVPFIMALQTARLILVILLGPRLARLLADRSNPT